MGDTNSLEVSAHLVCDCGRIVEAPEITLDIGGGYWVPSRWLAGIFTSVSSRRRLIRSVQGSDICKLSKLVLGRSVAIL